MRLNVTTKRWFSLTVCAAIFGSVGVVQSEQYGGYNGGYYIAPQNGGGYAVPQQNYGATQYYPDANGYVVIGPGGYSSPQQLAPEQPQQERRKARRAAPVPVNPNAGNSLNYALPDPALNYQTPSAPPSEAMSLVRATDSSGNLDEVVGHGVIFHSVVGGETLSEVARAYDLGYNDLSLANPGVNVWNPPPGSNLRLPLMQILPVPSQKKGLVINLPEMRIYHMRSSNRVDTFPVGIGKIGTDTPTGKAKLVRKKARPTWHVPKSILDKNPGFPITVPPGPENPLGTHALYLSIAGYLIHGTTQPYGIGRRVSHGCIRMYPEDIIQLFGQTAIGEPVSLVNKPVKVGWRAGGLYLEVHPQLTNRRVGNMQKLAQKEINSAIKRRSAGNVPIDWNLVSQVVSTQDGTPTLIGGVTSMHAGDRPQAPQASAAPASPSTQAMMRPAVANGAYNPASMVQPASYPAPVQQQANGYAVGQNPYAVNGGYNAPAMNAPGQGAYGGIGPNGEGRRVLFVNQ